MTAGDEFPRPGRSTFQATPESADHFVGSDVSFETPVPSAPRKLGQESARRLDGADTIRQSITRVNAQWTRAQCFMAESPLQFPKILNLT